MRMFFSIVLVAGFVVLLVAGLLSGLRDLISGKYLPTEPASAGAEEIMPIWRGQSAPPAQPDQDGHIK
jgi:hypothetical protein